MSNRLAKGFRADLDSLRGELLALSPALADTPWRAGGWTRKEIVGHLLDSAANNRQRFVRASTGERYTGPQYSQDGWVAAHGYAGQSWETLVRWWQVEHEILAAVVDCIAEDRLNTVCVVGEEPPMTLLFLIEDYIVHQRWHFGQMAAT